MTMAPAALQPLDDDVIVLGHIVRVEARAESGAQALRQHEILDRDRERQRAARPPRRAPAARRSPRPRLRALGCARRSRKRGCAARRHPAPSKRRRRHLARGNSRARTWARDLDAGKSSIVVDLHGSVSSAVGEGLGETGASARAAGRSSASAPGGDRLPWRCLAHHRVRPSSSACLTAAATPSTTGTSIRGRGPARQALRAARRPARSHRRRLPRPRGGRVRQAASPFRRGQRRSPEKGLSSSRMLASRPTKPVLLDAFGETRGRASAERDDREPPPNMQAVSMRGFGEADHRPRPSFRARRQGRDRRRRR